MAPALPPHPCAVCHLTQSLVGSDTFYTCADGLHRKGQDWVHPAAACGCHERGQARGGGVWLPPGGRGGDVRSGSGQAPCAQAVDRHLALRQWTGTLRSGSGQAPWPVARACTACCPARGEGAWALRPGGRGGGTHACLLTGTLQQSGKRWESAAVRALVGTCAQVADRHLAPQTGCTGLAALRMVPLALVWPSYGKADSCGKLSFRRLLKTRQISVQDHNPTAQLAALRDHTVLHGGLRG